MLESTFPFAVWTPVDRKSSQQALKKVSTTTTRIGRDGLAWSIQSTRRKLGMQYLVCIQAGIKARRVRKRSLARSAQAPRSLHLVLRTTHALYTRRVQCTGHERHVRVVDDPTCSSNNMTQCKQMILEYSLGFTHASLWAALQGLYCFLEHGGSYFCKSIRQFFISH